MFVFDHPLAIAAFSIILGFIFKYAWDRWLSQSARISRQEFMTALENLAKECALRRESCIAVRQQNKAYFENLINNQAGCLEDAIEAEAEVIKRRGETRRALVLIMMTQIKICEALRLDCSDLGKMLVEMGATE